MGINNSGFSVGSWTINGANDGYLYTSDGNLSIGAINASVAKYISFFTGGTLISNERMRINANGVGIGTTNPTSALTVSGSSLISGISTIGNLRVTPVGTGVTVGSAGIVTYYGDGSQLSGVSGGVSISTNTFNQNQFLTYAVSTGSTTGLGVTARGLAFNPSTTRLGIGTANPLFTADVAGDVRVQSTNRMRFGGNSTTTNFFIQYNSTTNSLDFVAG